MARFFNKTRGYITVSKRDGTPMPVGPKRWVDVDPSDESSVSLMAAVRRGDLIRELVPTEPSPVELAPSEELSSKPADAPVVVAAVGVAVSKPSSTDVRSAPVSTDPKKSTSKALDVEKPGPVTTNPTSSSEAAEKHPSDKRRTGRE